jgi:hypothetical protein
MQSDQIQRIARVFIYQERKVAFIDLLGFAARFGLVARNRSFVEAVLKSVGGGIHRWYQRVGRTIKLAHKNGDFC